MDNYLEFLNTHYTASIKLYMNELTVLNLFIFFLPSYTYLYLSINLISVKQILLNYNTIINNVQQSAYIPDIYYMVRLLVRK